MTSGCGTRRTEDKPGSASGITIWLRGKSSSLRDDFPAKAQGFILPEDQASEKGSASRVTIRAAVDAYLESLRIKKRPAKTISGKTYELNLFTGFCKKSYIFGFHQKSKSFQRRKPWTKRQPSFRLPRFRGERSEESLLEGLHVGDHVFNLVVVNHVLERRHQ
jgi:hypothetical protein